MTFLLLASCTAEPPRSADPPDPAPDSDTTPADTAEQLPAYESTVFADDVVHAFALTLDPEARASLETAPTTYAPATFSDGERTLSVGVRLKGYSSFQPLSGKPNLRVSFDHYVDGQRYEGLEALDLVSEAEDPAAMSEALAYRLFRAAGQPASRTGFAALTIDDEAYGLYTIVEKKDDVLVEQWWPDDDRGTLYESSSDHWPCDLDDPGEPRCDCWEVDEVGDDSRADLEALCAAATDTADEAWLATVSSATDWPEVRGHMAMEMLLDAHDHYAGYMGNVYLYHPPESGGWALVPASMNSVFGSSRYVPGSCGSSGRWPEDFTGGILARRCWADAACTEELYTALGDAVEVLERSDLLATLDAWEVLLGPYAATDPKSGYTEADFTLQVGCIRDWLVARPGQLGPLLPVECLGSGGVLDVDGYGDLSTNGSCDRDAPDAVGYAVLATDGATMTLGRAPDGIAIGDEVLLLVAQGEDAGAWTFADVTAVGTDSVVLDRDPGLSGTLLLQRVPHYDAVTVRAGGLLTASAWDGSTGGVLAFRVAGALMIEDGGVVSVATLGYAGGPTGPGYNWDGYQGESWAGVGIGGAESGAGYNQANGAWAANDGGGGCNVGGGGGEHAGGATAGVSWNDVADAPEAGATYGDVSTLTFGSGGGGVVNLGGSSGPGGAGGGVLYVEAGSIVAEGAGALSADGGDGDSWAAGSWTYSAGGGAGGSLWLVAPSLSLVEGAISAVGGRARTDVSRVGGDGGEGRIHVECETVNGEACGSEALAGFTEPAASVD